MRPSDDDVGPCITGGAIALPWCGAELDDPEI